MSLGRFLKASSWRRYAGVLAVCAGAYGGMVALVPMLERVVVEQFAENYAWQVQQALNAGEVTRAVEIAAARVRVEHYDFVARRLLAQSLLADAETTEAVRVMLETLNRAGSVPRRDVYSVGFDPAADYMLLSIALEQQGRTAFAGEMAEAAADARRLAVGRDGDIEASRGKSVSCQSTDGDGTKTAVALSEFRLSPGVSMTSSGGLLFSQSATAEGVLDQNPPGSELLYVQVRGSAAMGFGGVLILSCNGAELIRIYVNDGDPRWITVPMPETKPLSNMALTATFVNDGFEPVTKADRNVELMRLEIGRGEPSDAQYL